LAVDSDILQLVPGFDSISNLDEHKINFTISVGSDNSAFIQRPNQNFKCTLYPPPSAQKIEVIKHSILLDRVIVLLSNCSICMYKCENETALLEQIIKQSEIKDAEDKSIMIQEITSMELIRTQDKNAIPPFDREILNEHLHLEKMGNVCGETFQEFLALGMSKGSVYLIHVNKLNQLYCRFTVHREAVTTIRYLPHTDTFVSSSL